MAEEESHHDSWRPALVLDAGSVFYKAGFGGEDFPRTIFPSIVGIPKIGKDAPVAGDDATNKKSLVTIKYPLQHGIVQNWDDMEEIWRHTFYNELRVDPAEHPVLLTEAPLNPKANRQRMAQIMFETFNVPAMFVAIQPLLSMYASGSRTGVVVDLGDTVSFSVPIYEGFAIPDAIVRNEVGGRDLTDYLMRLLAKRQCGPSASDRVQVQEIKEKHCYMAEDFDAERRRMEETHEEVQHKFHDATVVLLGVERCMCPEALFSPGLLEDYKKPGVQGLPQAICTAVMRSDADIREFLYENVVVSGGSSMFPNMQQRLEKELQRVVSVGWDVHVHAPPERRYSVWMGGSILCCLSTFEGQWIFREEYDQSGPDIVQRKCF